MLFCLLGKKKNFEIISVRNKCPRKQILKILANFRQKEGVGASPNVTQNSKPRSACLNSHFHIPRIDIFQFFLLLHPHFWPANTELLFTQLLLIENGNHVVGIQSKL